MGGDKEQGVIKSHLRTSTPEDSMMMRSYISPFSAATTSSFNSDSSSSSDLVTGFGLRVEGRTEVPHLQEEAPP